MRWLLLLCLAGCGPPADGLLRTAGTNDFRSFDPAQCYDMTNIDYARLVHQCLLDYDDAGHSLVPRLAAALPDVSADGLVYTFRLRPGVRYSTGRELVASDFIFALERVLAPATKSPGSQYYRGIRTMSAPDPLTLRVELSAPDPTFPFVMAMAFSAPLPPGPVDDRPPGTGPYVLARWRRNVVARFERNPHFDGPRPDFDAVEVSLGLDRLTQVMMFERGEIDLMAGLPAGDFVRLKRDPLWGPRMTSLTENSTFFLVMNCEVEPFTDVRVRRAVSHAIDRERIVRAVNGRGVPARGVIPPLLPGHDPHLPGYAHDPAEARRLLAEAGFGGGLRVTLWFVPGINDMQKVAEVIQQDLREVGINAALNPASYPTFLTATGKRGEVALSLAGWFQDYPDPSTFLDVLFSGRRITDEESTNTCFLDDAEVNRLIDLASATPTGPLRLQRYRDAERAVLDAAPSAFLFHNVSYALSSPRVEGYALHPVWVERLDRLRRARR